MIKLDVALADNLLVCSSAHFQGRSDRRTKWPSRISFSATMIPAPSSAVDEAIAFAAQSEPLFSGGHCCEVKYRVPGNVLGGGHDLLSSWPWLLLRLRRVRPMRKSFWWHSKTARRKSAGLPQSHIGAMSDFGSPRFAHRIRSSSRSCTIVPVPEGDHIEQWYAELIVFGSGRPTRSLYMRSRQRIPLTTAGRGVGFQPALSGRWGETRFRSWKGKAGGVVKQSQMRR